MDLAAAEISDRPAPRRILCAHIVAVMLVQSTTVGIMSVLPVLVRRRFAASDLQTLLITAAIPTFLSLSIFWNALLQRTSLRAYLLVYWLVGLLPLAFISFAHSYWHVLVCHLIGAVGAAGAIPVTSDLLKRFYPDRWRGRAFAIMMGSALAGGAAAGYVVGEWLNRDGEAFRIYMPAAALLQLAGISILVWLVAAARAEKHRSLLGGRVDPQKMFDPIIHMFAILRSDRSFLRYEAAFMTYGAGWMFCYALLPVLSTDKLNLSYAEFQSNTQVIFNLTMFLMIVPMGWVIDRIGAVRTCGIAFFMLAMYPVGLMLAKDAGGVGLASVAYGLALSGVHLAWTLGPVSFARDTRRVSHYAAIHATLVGVRGVLFQALAMGLYKLTGGFTGPFIIAACCFVWASGQMWRLSARLRRRKGSTEHPESNARGSAANPPGLHVP